MNNIYNKLPRPFFVLAPMDDVTDTAFRRLISETAMPDLFFTEFANADGLQSAGRESVLQKLKFTKNEKPLIAQIWGKDAARYEKTADEIVNMGFDGLDINFGCPVPKVVKNGCCSALADNPEKAGELISAAKKGLAGRIPLSVKCRLGVKEINLDWIKYLLQQDVQVITIHGRTTKEMSKVPMHWEVFDEIMEMRNKISPNTLIVANGDIQSYSEGVEKAKKYSLDGVMIGRGIFKDPFVFAKDSPWPGMLSDERLDMFVKHIKLYEESWGSDKNPSVLKKFAKIYVNGFDGASELRSSIMETNSLDEMCDSIAAWRKS